MKTIKKDDILKVICRNNPTSIKVIDSTHVYMVQDYYLKDNPDKWGIAYHVGQLSQEVLNQLKEQGISNGFFLYVKN